MIHWRVIIPLIIFLVIIFLIGIWANKNVMQSDSFLQEYFQVDDKWEDSSLQ